jgi:signal transduction histidine kinase
MELSLPVRLAQVGAGTRWRRPSLAAIGATGLALGVVSVLVSWTGNAPDQALASLVRGAGVVLPVAVGVHIWGRLATPRFGQLLVAAGLFTFVATLSASDDELLYSVGRVATWGAEPALVFLVLAFPSGRLPARVDRVLVGLMLLLVATLFFPSALLTDQFPNPSIWSTCVDTCPANAFQVVTPEPGWVGDLVVPLREVLASALYVAVALRLTQRIVRATPPMRRMLAPVLVAATFHAVLLPVALALRRSNEAPEAIVTTAWVLAAGLPIVAIAFLVGAAQRRAAMGAALYRLAPRLQAGPTPEQLTGLLADALDDPSLEVIYRGGQGEWFDDSGRPVSLPSPGTGRDLTVICAAGKEVAAIVHDEALSEERSFVEAVGSFAVMGLTNERLAAQVEASLHELRRSRERIAARLSLQNARLHAEVSAQLAKVKESRSRIVAAADEERRRIERNLHDGAQQRLVALRIKLELAEELARSQGLPDADQLHQLGEDVGEALDEVRSLARGVYPALLVGGGLDDALRAAARRSPVPATVAMTDVGRQPPQIEAAVYFCCLEAMQNAAKHANAKALAIVVSDGDALRFSVSDDGCGFDAGELTSGRGLVNMRDRVAAAGGTLVVTSAAGRGTSVAGTIPHPAL